MLVAALLLSFAFPEATRPDPLPDEAGCDHYTGTSSGNDPSVTFDVVLCPHEDGTEGKIQGKVQWSSLLSGWNLRKVEGNWTDGGLKMKDLEIIEERPEPGFRFCTIDEYELEKKDGGKLEGTYDSEDCNDHATVTLTAIAAPPDGSGPAPVDPPKPPENGDRNVEQGESPRDSKPSVPSRDENKSQGDDEQAKGGCGCDVTMLFAPLLLLGVRRKRDW